MRKLAVFLINNFYYFVGIGIIFVILTVLGVTEYFPPFLEKIFSISWIILIILLVIALVYNEIFKREKK